jgi:hypothetical protein
LRIRIGETKGREGPLGSNVVGASKGEITSITIEKGAVTFDNVGNHCPLRLECEDYDEPPPLEGKNIELHTNQKGFAKVVTSSHVKAT